MTAGRFDVIGSANGDAPSLWIAFVGTVILMQVPPGPDSMLVMARGIGQGRDVALFTVLGMTLGAGLVQLPLIAFGLSSLVHASPLAFNLLRWAGAAYIVWLGVRLLLSSSATIPTGDLKALRPLAAAQEGMIANLSNPWPLMFMVAFLPQLSIRTGAPSRCSWCCLAQHRR